MGINFWRLLVGATTLNMLVATGAFAAEKAKENNVVKDGTVVSLQYTLSAKMERPSNPTRAKSPSSTPREAIRLSPAWRRGLRE